MCKKLFKRLFKRLFKKEKSALEHFVAGLLNTYDADVIVIRGDDCQVLFMNDSARARSQIETPVATSCKLSYSAQFPALCKICPCQVHKHPTVPFSFDVTNKEGEIFSVTCNTIDWIDGEEATIFFLRKVNEIRTVAERLYSLAYVDQLTGVPNRRKFIETFESVSAEVAANRLGGSVTIFDIDSFKSVNDTYGHNTGDIMLKRLTEHFEKDPIFAGHLYRLGGDEFVLFYTHDISAFPTDEDVRLHYKGLLKGALLSYTLANIDLSCTISMGVSFFPKHGGTISELLRKADIALYEAKGKGGNQLTIFEDRYDKAQKLRDLYINVRPILKEHKRTFGYELIDNGHDGHGTESKGAFVLNEFNRTIDMLGQDDMESDARYFISYSNQLHSPTVRDHLPKNKFIIQVDVSPVLTPDGLALYRQLASYGYSLCANRLTHKNITPQLMALVQFCKFEPGAFTVFEQDGIIKQYPKKIFIATNVDTPLAFENAQKRGFKLSQGFFFNELPVMKKTKEIDPLKVNYLRLLKLSSAAGSIDFKEMSTIISSDVALSYKLLKLLNSAALGLRYRISSINMAVAYLGEEKLKRWIAMLALRGLASDQPLELLRISLIRAQFGEFLAPHFRPRRDAKHVFMVGMFSLLHIALEKTKEELMEEIPVAQDVRDSLLTKNGIYSDLLTFFTNHEYGNWEEVNRFVERNQLNSETVNDAYISAVKWYNDLTATQN